MRLLALIPAVVAVSVLAETTVVRLSEPVEATAAYEVFGAPLPDKNPGLSLLDIIERESDFAGRGAVSRRWRFTGRSSRRDGTAISTSCSLPSGTFSAANGRSGCG